MKKIGTANSVLTQMARESLRNNWGKAIGAHVLYILTEAAAPSFIGILIAAPMDLGITSFSLSIARKTPVSAFDVFKGFNRFVTALLTYVLLIFFVLFWSALFTLPGFILALVADAFGAYILGDILMVIASLSIASAIVIVSLSYSMTLYIVADNINIKVMDALRQSQKLMDGYKWKLFCLFTRFIGWALLCLLTVGIGLLWLIPYISISIAQFYDDIKVNLQLPNAETVNPTDTQTSTQAIPQIEPEIDSPDPQDKPGFTTQTP